MADSWNLGLVCWWCGSGYEEVLKTVEDKLLYMTGLKDKVSSFDRKNLSAAVIIGFVSLVMVGGAVSQSTPSKSVGIGENGIKLFTGGLDVNGNDISDDGTTIWDASAGQIASSVVDFSTATASDVGLGNVENEAQVAEGGDTMSGDLTLDDGAIIKGASGMFAELQSDNAILLDRNGDTSEESSEIQIDSNGVSIDTDPGTTNDCLFYSSSGDLECDGSISGSSKNFVQSINKTHEVVYTSQESPEARAVYEGEAFIVDSKKVELPSHFTKVVSNTNSELRVQVTPQGTFTKAVAMNKTDEYIEIKVGKETDVNYRITGVREGYEDKQVVRPKK
jgi:hypothetical protein